MVLEHMKIAIDTNNERHAVINNSFKTYDLWKYKGYVAGGLRTKYQYQI